MRFVLKTILFVLFTCFMTGVTYSAELILKSGEAIKGKILEEKTNSYLIQTSKGVQIEVQKSDIGSIDYTDGKAFKQEYLITGVTLGLPGALNFVGGYYWKEMGFKLSGSYWSGLFWGAQLDVSKKLIENKDLLLDASILAGHVGANINWSGGSAPYLNYVGAGVGINLVGFAAEISPTYSEGPGLLFLWQFGYIHRFN